MESMKVIPPLAKNPHRACSRQVLRFLLQVFANLRCACHTGLLQPVATWSIYEFHPRPKDRFLLGNVPG